MQKITLPFGFIPRSYQLPIYEFLDRGGKRAVLVWHRRAGKDSSMLNYIIKEAWRRVGVYYHLFPTFTQGKKIIWDGRTREGRKFLDYFPKALLEGKPNDTEMKIRMRNGSIYQIIGTDQFDSVVGPNPVGCVFSEYALQNPKAWDLIRPILTENEGWAVFIFTPRGSNHGKRIYDTAVSNPGRWFHEMLTIEETKRDDGSPVVRVEDVEQEIKEGMDSELARQEYYCSWNAPRSGSYYGALIEQAEKDGRISGVPYDPKFPVDTWWDLGIGDSTAIWFTQSIGREIRVINYLEGSGVGISWYAKELKEKGYFYGRHGFPFDAEAKELGTGTSIEEQAYSLGIQPIDIIPKLAVEDGIAAARAIIPRCWFDREKCQKGLDALRSYHKEWDDKTECYKLKPVHDWSSHAADAFRYFAIGFKENIGGVRQVVAKSSFDPYTYNTDQRYLNQQEQAETEWNIFGV